MLFFIFIFIIISFCFLLHAINESFMPLSFLSLFAFLSLLWQVCKGGSLKPFYLALSSLSLKPSLENDFIAFNVTPPEHLHLTLPRFVLQTNLFLEDLFYKVMESTKDKVSMDLSALLPRPQKLEQLLFYNKKKWFFAIERTREVFGDALTVQLPHWKVREIPAEAWLIEKLYKEKGNYIALSSSLFSWFKTLIFISVCLILIIYLLRAVYKAFEGYKVQFPNKTKIHVLPFAKDAESSTLLLVLRKVLDNLTVSLVLKFFMIFSLILLLYYIYVIYSIYKLQNYIINSTFSFFTAIAKIKGLTFQGNPEDLDQLLLLLTNKISNKSSTLKPSSLISTICYGSLGTVGICLLIYLGWPVIKPACAYILWPLKALFDLLKKGGDPTDPTDPSPGGGDFGGNLIIRKKNGYPLLKYWIKMTMESLSAAVKEAAGPMEKMEIAVKTIFLVSQEKIIDCAFSSTGLSETLAKSIIAICKDVLNKITEAGPSK